MNQFKMEVTAKRLKNRRKELGLIQSEVAEKAGITPQALSTYENGSIPRMDILWPLADALECEPDYLLGKIQHPRRSTSDISDLIPLSRESIEALESMQFQLKEWSAFDSALLISIIDALIIHLEKTLHRHLLNENGYLNDSNDFLLNAVDILFAYEKLAGKHKVEEERSARLTISGASHWIASDLADVIRKAIKEVADPDNKVKSAEV